MSICQDKHNIATEVNEEFSQESGIDTGGTFVTVRAALAPEKKTKLQEPKLLHVTNETGKTE